MHALPSLHAIVLLVKTHPVAGLHESLVQTLPSEHVIAVPEHEPPEQRSPLVHALLSLQDAVLFVNTHPEEKLHESSVQPFPSEQVVPQVRQLLVVSPRVPQPAPSPLQSMYGAVQTHADDMHVEFEPQLLLQALQWSCVIRRSVSQPLLSVPSQLPQLPLHDAIRQDSVAHVAVALVRLQDTPQPPQWVKVVRRCSQPLLSSPSQLPQPELQDWMRQEPVEQVALALLRLHEEPHDPQSLSVLRGVSQPLLSTPSQLSKPASQR